MNIKEFAELVNKVASLHPDAEVTSVKTYGSTGKSANLKIELTQDSYRAKPKAKHGLVLHIEAES